MTRSASAVGQNTSFHQALLLKVFVKYRMMELNRLFVESFFYRFSSNSQNLYVRRFSPLLFWMSLARNLSQSPEGEPRQKNVGPGLRQTTQPGPAELYLARASHEFPRLELESEVLLHGLRTGSV